MLTGSLVQSAHCAWVDFDQTSRALDATAIGQMFRHRNGFGFRYLAIPQRRVLPLAELFLTAPAAQVTYLVGTVHFSDYQIVAALLTVQVAVGVDTC